MTGCIMTVSLITTKNSIHPCDAPGLTPHEFLLRVMRDPALDLSVRMNAAVKLCKLWPEEAAHRPPSLRIIIGGLDKPEQEQEQEPEPEQEPVELKDAVRDRGADQESRDENGELI